MSSGQFDSLLEHLQHGELSVEGQFMWGSNYTFLAQIQHDGQSLKAVYKPTQGERPLWDFPSETLAGREVAAFLVSEALGVHLVPPTVYRGEAPSGPGSLQLFVEHDPNYHYFNFKPEDRARLRPVALFDALVNNTDRKGGHILVDPQNNLWLIDHGVCFHVQPKLRTVIWDFAGEPFTEEACRQLTGFRQKLAPESAVYQELSRFLARRELAALAHRADQLLEEGRFPAPTEDRYSYPWPPV